MKNLLKFFRNRTPLGWLQLSHDRGRLITAVSGIAFADILIFMQLGFLNALFDSSVLLHRSLKADLVMINPQALNLAEMSTFPRRRLYQAQDIPGVVSTSAIYINSVRWKNPQTLKKTSVMVIGIDVDHPVLNLPEVNQKLDQLKLPDTFLFDRKARGEYKKMIAALEQGKPLTTDVSFGLYALARKATTLPMYITLFRALAVFLLTLIMCVISGTIATRKLQAADPADIFS